MADRMAMKIEGGPELAKVLNALPLAVRRKTLIKILKRAAEPIGERMAANAPRGDTPALGPNGEALGHLAGSIKVSVAGAVGGTMGGRWERTDEMQAAVAVGPDRNHPYGIFLEYGTVKMGAQPFMRPAFDGTAVSVSLPMIQDDIWDAIYGLTRSTAPSGFSGPVMGGPGGGGLL